MFLLFFNLGFINNSTFFDIFIKIITIFLELLHYFNNFSKKLFIQGYKGYKMSLHQETTVVQSLFGHLLHSDQNESKVVNTLLSAAYNSWKIQAPEIVIHNPSKDILYINAGVAWLNNDTPSITTKEHLNEDITLFTVQEISFWIGELWNLDSVEEFSEVDVADALGNYILEYVESQNFYDKLSFDTEKNVFLGTEFQVTRPAPHMGIAETTVSFPINVPELLSHLVKSSVFKESLLEQYKVESDVFYGTKCPKSIRIDRDEKGAFFVVKSAAGLISEYIADSNRARSLALKIASLSKNKAKIVEKNKIVAELVDVIDTNYLYDEISAIIVKRSEETVYTLEEIKQKAWKELTIEVDTLLEEYIPGYKESKWTQKVIEQLLPYEIVEPLLVTHTKNGKEIAFKKDPEDIHKEWLDGTGITKFKLKVNCVLVDTTKVLDIIKNY